MLKFPLALLAKPAKSIQFKGKKLRPISEIPSPKDWPFLGNFWKFRHPDPAIGKLMIFQPF